MLALAFTLALEAPIVMAATMRLSVPTWRRMSAAVVPSCLSHPFAWRAIGNFGSHDYLYGLLLVEFAVVIFEAVCLRLILRISARTSVLLSLGANAASTLLGWVLL